jgi:hypothetical protein
MGVIIIDACSTCKSKALKLSSPVISWSLYQQETWETEQESRVLFFAFEVVKGEEKIAESKLSSQSE